MEYIALIYFIYFIFGIIVSCIIFISTFDLINVKDKNLFQKLSIYILYIVIMIIIWPILVVRIIRMYYKTNKEDSK
jgi:hypothetical protein